MRAALLLIIVLFSLFGCNNQKQLATILKSKPILQEVSSNKEKYRVQVIYTTVGIDKQGNYTFKDFKFNLDTSQYFYPASTAKLLVSAFALEYLNTETEGKINLETHLKAFPIGPCQTPDLIDVSSKDLQPTLGNYINRMLLVSDNAAYNRVFDFVGQDYLQRRFTEMGFEEARIIQRFDPNCNAEANRFHNRFEFYREDSAFLYSHTARTTKIYSNPTQNVGIGKAYYYGDSLVQKPRSFRSNNNLPLEVLHESMKRLIYPQAYTSPFNFNLPMAESNFIKTALGRYPYESTFPKYDTSYFPAYKKYLYYGKEKNAIIDSGLRIYNIVGQAYGFTTDIAFFEDIENGVSFFLSATIYTNEDGILNDDKYEYNSIAFPFMKALGQEIYKKELKAKHSKKKLN